MNLTNTIATKGKTTLFSLVFFAISLSATIETFGYFNLKIKLVSPIQKNNKCIQYNIKIQICKKYNILSSQPNKPHSYKCANVISTTINNLFFHKTTTKWFKLAIVSKTKANNKQPHGKT
jgi:hypothetical protein